MNSKEQSILLKIIQSFTKEDDDNVAEVASNKENPNKNPDEIIASLQSRAKKLGKKEAFQLGNTVKWKDGMKTRDFLSMVNYVLLPKL